MASTPLKKRKNASVLWEHARKVFCENGSVKYIKCDHCRKTSSTTSNALRHLKSTHFNHLGSSKDSKKKLSHTYELKCAIVRKLKDGIERSKIQEDHGIDEETLSKCYKKWFTSDDKIIAKVNGEIQPVSEEDIDDDVKCDILKKALTGVDMSKIQKDYNIDEETLSKCYRKWFTPDDKILAKANAEIQAVSEEDIANEEDDDIVHEEDNEDDFDKADDNDKEEDADNDEEEDNNDDDDDDDNDDELCNCIWSD